MTQVAVIIVSFRNPADVIDCLEGLAAQSHPVERVVICENGGGDHAAELEAQIADRRDWPFAVQIVNQPDNPGYGGGINRAIAACPHGGHYWILNPDTVPAPDALGEMLHCMERGGFDLVGGVICGEDGTIKDCGGNFSPALGYVRVIGRGLPGSTPPQPGEVMKRLSFVTGANMLLSRRFLDLAGPIREDYFLYSEEVEWCVRAAMRGARIGYCPSALVVHKHGTSTGNALDFKSRPRLPIYLDTRNRLHTVADTRPRWLPVAVPAVLLLAVLRFARRGAWKQAGYAAEGWRAALRNERGKPSWMLSRPAG